MKTKTLLAATSVAVLTIAAASQAFAQAAKPAAPAAAPARPAAAAGPAAPPISYGPAVPGVCTVSIDGAIGLSTVGKFYQTRMQQIATQVQSELTAEQTAIENDAKALDGQKATLDQGSFDKRNADLQIRANAFTRKRDLRGRELQATEQKALGRIYQELQPVVQQVFQTNHCSLLFSREAMVIANPATDITQAVATGLNAKLTQFTFDRERLDQAAATAQTPR